MRNNIIEKRRVAAEGGGTKSSAADGTESAQDMHNKYNYNRTLRTNRQRGFFAFSMICILLMKAVTILMNVETQISPLDFIPALLTQQYVGAADNNITAEWMIDMPNDTRMEFIHIGKTGGVTILKSFDLFRKRSEVKCIVAKPRVNTTANISPCNTNRAHDSKIYNHTIGHYHMDGGHMKKEEREWLLQNSNTFLYSIRDPISRIISTYNYHRDRGEYNKGLSYSIKYKRFIDCFPLSINDTINMLRTRRNDNDENAKQCRALGENVIKGKTAGGGPHFQMNYNFYNEYTIKKYPNHFVAVIRTEYMWDDILNLEKALGGSGDFKNVGFKHSHGSEKYGMGTRLSIPNTIYLCCLLYEDIEIYQQLILKSINLNGLQKKESLSNLMARCQTNEVEGIDLLDEPFSWKAYSKSSTCNNSIS